MEPEERETLRSGLKPPAKTTIFTKTPHLSQWAQDAPLQIYTPMALYDTNL
jgi:hypothetical protein